MNNCKTCKRRYKNHHSDMWCLITRMGAADEGKADVAKWRSENLKNAHPTAYGKKPELKPDAKDCPGWC